MLGSRLAVPPLPPKLEQLAGSSSAGIIPQTAWDSFWIRKALPESSHRRELWQHDCENRGTGTGGVEIVGLSRLDRGVSAAGAALEGDKGADRKELGREGKTVEKRRKESEVDELEVRSEEAHESSEDLAKPPPSRASSKRSRAAEVHNLSEKRRRRRINEKMKALQKLIPNANKTDKASMLDEAIEYLKQLQLQVQMLSMRNGLPLPSMYMSQEVQLMQMPQMTTSLGATENSLPVNMGMKLPPLNEATVHRSINLSSQCASPLQPTVMPSVMNAVSNSETTFGLDTSQDHLKQYQFPTSADEMHRANILPQQLNIIQSARTAGREGQPLKRKR